MQNKLCVSDVRTNKSERLFMRCTLGYKKAVQDFCNEHGMTISFFLDSLIRSTMKKRNRPIQGQIINTWNDNIDEMPTEPLRKAV